MTTAILIAALTASSPGLAMGKQVRFVGFSKDEAAALFRVDATEATHDGGHVSYTFYRLVETRSGELVATFSGGLPQCRSGRNRKIRCNKGVVGDANFTRAVPKKELQRFMRKARLKQKVLQANDSTLRLARDPDAPGEMDAATQHIDFFGEPGQPVGFGPVVRLMDGRLIQLGHYRVEAEEGTTWHGRVSVHHSRTGQSVAVLARFDRGDGSPPVWDGAVYPLPDPVGTTAIGTFNLVYSSLRHAQVDYEALHPEYGDMYDQYVGAHW